MEQTMNKKYPKGLMTHPSVFAVEDEYQIMMLVEKEVLTAVTVNGETYYDHVCGVRRSNTEVHRIAVPRAELDAAGCYTLEVSEIIERKPYCPDIEEPCCYEYPFYPLTKTEDIVLHHISDVHGRVEDAIASTKAADRKADVLIFNGDIPNHCGNFTEMRTLLQVASAVGEGSIPCVSARGNHDCRGCYAENYMDFLPNRHGLSYYTFRIGCIWGVVLDCGEDKVDGHAEYGPTLCCHAFRKKQTEFLRNVSGYDNPDVKYRLVVCHTPFSYTGREPFDIEIPLFTEWSTILKERVKPHLMLCGHTHSVEVCEIGGRRDHKGQPCPMIIAGIPRIFKRDPSDEPCSGHISASITLNPGSAEVVAKDNTGYVGFTATLAL